MGTRGQSPPDIVEPRKNCFKKTKILPLTNVFWYFARHQTLKPGYGPETRKTTSWTGARRTKEKRSNDAREQCEEQGVAYKRNLKALAEKCHRPLPQIAVATTAENVIFGNFQFGPTLSRENARWQHDGLQCVYWRWSENSRSITSQRIFCEVMTYRLTQEHSTCAEQQFYVIASKINFATRTSKKRFARLTVFSNTSKGKQAA